MDFALDLLVKKLSNVLSDETVSVGYIAPLFAAQPGNGRGVLSGILMEEDGCFRRNFFMNFRPVYRGQVGRKSWGLVFQFFFRCALECERDIRPMSASQAFLLTFRLIYDSPVPGKQVSRT